MENIIIKRIDKNTVVVSFNDISTESKFKEIIDEKEQYMIALADYLGFEPAEILNLEW